MMNKRQTISVTITLCVIGVANLNAQENSGLQKQGVSTTPQYKIAPLTFNSNDHSRAVLPSQQEPQDGWTLETYQRKVDEIKTKIEWVKSHPEEDKKANTNGWYTEAYELLRKAEYELKTYKQKTGARQQSIDELKQMKAKLDAIDNDPKLYKESVENGDYDVLRNKIIKLEQAIEHM